MIILALDYGRRRIGLAVSDPLGIAAHGLPTLERQDVESDIEAIVALIRERKADRVVIGMPFNMDGTSGPQAAEVKDFSDRLAAVAGMPVEAVDERLSTYEAQEGLKQMGIKAKNWRRYVDQLAAKVILTRYLERVSEKKGKSV